MSSDGFPGRLLAAFSGRGLVRAPSLQTGEERTASRLELFFDLAFVLVVAELAGALRHDVTWHGVGVFTGLFTVTWWSWMSTTLYANRFDHDDVVFRLYKLTSMLVVIGLAAAAADATGRRSVLFAGCNVVLRLLLLTQYARAYRHVHTARATVRLYLRGTGVGAVLWAVSTVVLDPTRYVLWAVAVLVEAAVPLLSTAVEEDVPLHLEHLPERFALFVILVLGESVTGVAQGVRDAHWSGDAVAVGVAAFVLAAALWWTWFDLAGAGAKQLLARSGGHRSAAEHDVFVFGQLPLCLALAAVGAGIQLAVLQSTAGEVPAGTRLLLAGGVALYLAAVGVTNAAMARTWRSVWLWPAAAAVLAGVDAAVALPAVVVVGALAALLVAVLVVGVVGEAEGHLEVDPV